MKPTNGADGRAPDGPDKPGGGGAPGKPGGGGPGTGPTPPTKPPPSQPPDKPPPSQPPDKPGGPTPPSNKPGAPPDPFIPGTPTYKPPTGTPSGGSEDAQTPVTPRWAAKANQGNQGNGINWAYWVEQINRADRADHAVTLRGEQQEADRASTDDSGGFDVDAARQTDADSDDSKELRERYRAASKHPERLCPDRRVSGNMEGVGRQEDRGRRCYEGHQRQGLLYRRGAGPDGAQRPQRHSCFPEEPPGLGP